VCVCVRVTPFNHCCSYFFFSSVYFKCAATRLLVLHYRVRQHKSQLFISFHLFIFVLYCSFIGVFFNPTSGCWEPRPCSRNQRIVVCAHVRRAPWRHILLKPRRTCHQRVQWPHVLGRGDVDVANLACVSPRRRTRRAQVRASMASLLLPIVSKISWFDKLYMNFLQR
jgi:hypothetical protein